MDAYLGQSGRLLIQLLEAVSAAVSLSSVAQLMVEARLIVQRILDPVSDL